MNCPMCCLSEQAEFLTPSNPQEFSTMNATESAQPLRSSGLPRCRWIMFPLLAMLAFCPTVTLFAQPSAYTVHALQEVVLDDTQYQTFASSVTNVADRPRLVAGYAYRDNLALQPVVWTVNSEGGSVHRLLNFDASLFAGAGASGVNHHGQIIGNGRFDLASSGSLGLYWPDAASAPLLLPGLAGETSSQVLRINDSGVVVGISRDASGSRAVAWRILAGDSIVGPLELPTRRRGEINNLPNGPNGIGPTSAAGITEIAGSSDGAPVVWRVLTNANGDLELAGDIEVLDRRGEATGVISSGAVCGRNQRNKAVIWEPLVRNKKRSVTRLKNNGDLSGYPLAMNDAGLIVGGSFNFLLLDRQGVVVWLSPSDPVQTLQSLISGGLGDFRILDNVSALSEANEIVGSGWMGREIGQQAFIALPVK